MENSSDGLLFDEKARRIILAHYGIQNDPYDDLDSREVSEVTQEPYFTNETLMPMPEKSYAQELLDQPVPLASRIAHLVSYIDIEPSTHGELNTEYSIAKQIGAPVSWVKKRAIEIGIESTPSHFDPDDIPHNIYPSPSLELLREELRWHREIAELDTEVKVGEFGRLLGKTEEWSMKYASELGFVVNYVPSESGGRARMLPRVALGQLRHLILMFPPQDDWLTENEVSLVTGREPEWLASHLGRVGIMTQQRWSSLTGKLLHFYPPDTEEAYLRMKSELPQPAGNWLSAAGIARKLAMTDEWTSARLREINDSTAETRLNDINVPRLHYSPATVAIVEHIAEMAKGVPEIEDWYSVSSLSRAINMSDSWVARRLSYIASVPQLRRDSAYRIFAHYPPEALDELRQIQHVKLSDLRAGNL